VTRELFRKRREKELELKYATVANFIDGIFKFLWKKLNQRLGKYIFFEQVIGMFSHSVSFDESNFHVDIKSEIDVEVSKVCKNIIALVVAEMTRELTVVLNNSDVNKLREVEAEFIKNIKEQVS
jgi:hypothetical protein